MLPFSEAFKAGVDSIIAHKMRSALTALGVVFGVAAVIAMLSISEGARRDAVEQIKLLGTNNIRVRHLALSGEKADQAAMKGSQGLTDHDRQIIAATLPNTRGVSPVRFVDAEVRLGKRTSSCVVIGTDDGYDEVTNFRATEGRFLSALDVQRANRVCVIGQQVRRDVFGFGNAINRRLRIDDDWFTVVGVMQSKTVKEGKSSVIRIRDINRDVYIPVSTALTRFTDPDRPEAIDEIAVQVHDESQVTATADVLRRLVTRTHRGAADFEIVVPSELLAQSQRTQRLFNIVMGSIAAISLLVGGIGIMNIMLANVSERTSEIGLRMALGATERDIVNQFLNETVLVSVGGGVIGIVLGATMAKIINLFAGWQTVISPWNVGLSFIIAAAVGVGFGVYPALKAARLDPVEALRHE